MQYRPHLPV